LFCPGLSSSLLVPQVLIELGEGGGEGGTEAAAQRLPPKQALTDSKLGELKKQALVVNELMRHFWALLPVNTEGKKKKFHRLQVREGGLQGGGKGMKRGLVGMPWKGGVG
jgi:hypothetical protein